MHVVSNQLFLNWQGAIDNVLLLARATSGAELDDAVQTVIERHLGVDHFSLFGLDPARPPVIIAAGGRDRDGVSPTLARAYAARFCRLDPVASSIQERPPTDQILVHNRRAAEVRDTSYRRECYDKPGITERLTVHSALGGRWRTLHLYRKHRSPGFTESDVENAVRAAACILTVVPAVSARERTNDTPGRISWFDERLHRLPGRLTGRECQVCARALVGMSVEGTALDLDIAPTSVATYRKRAYQKLGITSQNEMFALLC